MELSPLNLGLKVYVFILVLSLANLVKGNSTIYALLKCLLTKRLTCAAIRRSFFPSPLRDEGKKGHLIHLLYHSSARSLFRLIGRYNKIVFDQFLSYCSSLLIVNMSHRHVVQRRKNNYLSKKLLRNLKCSIVVKSPLQFDDTRTNSC